jgi:NAD(P)-dependent dehydrogenase (short-subunit alcohol dehydrogenase family)
MTYNYMASPQKVAYVAAKHGVVAMTKVAAVETANYGITVNAILDLGTDWCPRRVSLLGGSEDHYRRTAVDRWRMGRGIAPRRLTAPMVRLQTSSGTTSAIVMGRS